MLHLCVYSFSSNSSFIFHLMISMKLGLSVSGSVPVLHVTTMGLRPPHVKCLILTKNTCFHTNNLILFCKCSSHTARFISCLGPKFGFSQIVPIEINLHHKSSGQAVSIHISPLAPTGCSPRSLQYPWK